jgi:hypothetical protein
LLFPQNPCNPQGRREQNIVWQLTQNNGTSWTAPLMVAHNAGSRNGMPGLARLQNGSLIVVGSWLYRALVSPSHTSELILSFHQVFEGFWELWGDFSVSYALSHDLGRTWINRQRIYDPPGASMAGAPQVAVDASGRVYASCMTNDMDGPNYPPWDDRTGVRVWHGSSAGWGAVSATAPFSHDPDSLATAPTPLPRPMPSSCRCLLRQSRRR